MIWRVLDWMRQHPFGTAAAIGVVLLAAQQRGYLSNRGRKRRRRRNGEQDPARMTAGQINKALDALDRASSKITDEFIAVGRGHERPSETWKLDDPLARKWKQVTARQAALRNEIALRYGPGAPHRLPRGFGPRAR